MVAITLPTSTAPGQHPQESGGRLINCFAESLGKTAGSQIVLRRVPGLELFGGAVGQENYRGGQLVGADFYAAFNGKVVSLTTGGVETALTGTLAGTDGVIWARNNAATPDLVVVSPANGASVVSTTTVSAYPDVDVGSPNSVCFLKGYFIFTYGDGKVRSSGINSTSINLLDNATAESKPDTLYRGIPLGNGQLLLAGSGSMEIWGGQNDTGFPFSYIQTIPRGICGRYAIAGHEDGFGYGIFFVGDDNKVSRLNGYQPDPISPPDLDRLIEAVTDKNTIQVGVFVNQGHGFVVVQCTSWTWIYDNNTGTWHEHISYEQGAWRGLFPHNAFGKWLVGDRNTGNILALNTLVQGEVDDPLRMTVETGPMGQFPQGTRVNRLDLLVSTAVGLVTGASNLIEPVIDIWMSKDNGLTWGNAWQRKLGPVGRTVKVTVNNLGHCGPQGVKFKFAISDGIHAAIMGGDVDVSLIGK